ncbi:MAG: hypothetical protein AAF740_00885 [Bacteroidota bacterium]
MQTQKMDSEEYLKEAVILISVLIPFVYALLNWSHLPDSIPIRHDYFDNDEVLLSKIEYVIDGGIMALVFYFLMMGGKRRAKRKRMYRFRLLLHSYLSGAFLLVMIGTDNPDISVPLWGTIWSILLGFALFYPMLRHKFFREQG